MALFSTYTAVQLSFVSSSLNPAFLWADQVTNILFDTTNKPFAVGDSFILRSQGGAILQMSLGSVASLAIFELDVTGDTEVISSDWGINETQATMALQVGVISPLSGLVDTVIENPALSHAIPDQSLSFNVCAAGYTSTLSIPIPRPTPDPSTIAGITCSSEGTIFELGDVETYPDGVLVLDPGFVTIDPTTPDFLDITVSDINLTPIGFYKVNAEPGFLDDSDPYFILEIYSEKGFLVPPTIPESPFSYEIRDIVSPSQTFTVGAYTIANAFECPMTDSLSISIPMPWVTLIDRDVTIGGVADPALDGQTIIFTIKATATSYRNNNDLQFPVYVTAPCRQATINALTFDDIPEILAVDGDGPVTQIFHHSGVSYGGLLEYCGTLSFTVVDDLGLPFGSWVTLELDIDPTTESITAEPFSTGIELQGVHLAYIKVSIVSPNYNDTDIAPLLQPVTITVNSPPCDCTQLIWLDSAWSSESLEPFASLSLALYWPATDYNVNHSTRQCTTEGTDCFYDLGLAFSLTDVTLEDDSAIPTWMVSDFVNYEIQMTPTYTNTPLQYDIKAWWTMSDPSVLVYSRRTVYITVCEVASYSDPSITSMSLAAMISDSPTTFSIEQWTQSPVCAHPDTLIVVPDLSVYSWIELVGRDLIVDPSVFDGSLNGGVSQLLFVVTSTLLDDPNYTTCFEWGGQNWAGTDCSANPQATACQCAVCTSCPFIGIATVELTVDIFDPCNSSVTINEPIEWATPQEFFMTDGTTSFGQFTWSDVSDPACLPEIYEPLAFTFEYSANGAAFNENWISAVYSASGDDFVFDLTPIGIASQILDLQIVISIPSYAGVILSVATPFTVSICGDVTSLTPPIMDWSLFQDYELTVDEPASVILDPYTQVGGYEDLCVETLSISPSISQLPWITMEGRNITVNSTDLSLGNDIVEFTVTSSVNDFDATSNSSLTFTVSFKLPELETGYEITLNETEPETVLNIIKNETNASNQTENSASANVTEVNLVDFFRVWFTNAAVYDAHAKPLIASLEDISQTGKLTISFNKEMLVPAEFNSYQNDDSAAIFQIERLIDISVISSRDFGDDESDLHQIDSYELVDYENKTLVIQINFRHPNYISMNQADKDRLRVNFRETWFFVDSHERQQLPEDTIMSIEIENQLTYEQEAAMKLLEQQVDNIMDYSGGATLILNISLAFALKYFWNMTNLFQFLVFMCQWELSYPQNSLIVLRKVKNLALFEFLPTQDISEWMSSNLGLERSECTDEECTTKRRMLAEDNLQEDTNSVSNFGSDNLIKNMGIMLVVALGITLFVLIFKLMKWFAYTDYKWYRRYMMLHDKIFYNLFIRYILQSTLKLQIAACTTLTLISWVTYSGIIQGTISIIVLTSMVLSPLIFALVIYQNFSDLERLSIDNKIGSMYVGIHLVDKTIYPLSYTIVFLLRRTLFAVLTFTLFNYPTLQILAFIMSSMMYVIYLNSQRIYAERFSLFFENLNEAILIVICYHILLFTNVLDDPNLLTDVGKSMIIAVGIVFVNGTLVILFINIKGLVMYLKKRKAQHKQKKMLAARQEEADQAKLHLFNLSLPRNAPSDIELLYAQDQLLVESIESSKSISKQSNSSSPEISSSELSNSYLQSSNSDSMSLPQIEVRTQAQRFDRINKYIKPLSRKHNNHMPMIEGQTFAELCHKQELCSAVKMKERTATKLKEQHRLSEAKIKFEESSFGNDDIHYDMTEIQQREPPIPSTVDLKMIKIIRQRTLERRF